MCKRNFTNYRSPKKIAILRFIWIDDILPDNPKLLIYRFTVQSCLWCQVCFVPNATIDHHIRSYAEDPSFVDMFQSSLYVDDLDGGDTREDAIELFSKSRRRMSEGGFMLRKWKTNDQELRQLIVETEDCKTHTDEITYTICGGYNSHFRSTGVQQFNKRAKS